MNLPLKDICVVSLEQAVAAPFATRQLADLGARVIKVERPGIGDFARGYDNKVRGLSAFFIWLNRSKESLTLDLKHDEALNILEGLLDKADVFIQNLAPGATNRLGLSSERLSKRYPGLVICDISGYGKGGPYSKKKAYDLLIQCETGLASITGTPDTPSKVGISIADIATGMYVYSGVLTALLQKEKTGKGTSFEVSMLEALGEWMMAPAYFTEYGGAPPPRTGASHATIYPYGPFSTGDGGTLFLGIQNEREWVSFCEKVLEQPELANDQRFDTNTARIDNREVLDKIIKTCFDEYGSDETLERLDRAQIANGRLNSPKEFWAHPQLKARGRWAEIDSPEGKLETMLPPVVFEGMKPQLGPVPGLGENTEKILEELGYRDDVILRLKEEGAI